ncbi:outer membrane beta-barrel protein [Hymenobacter chitinivorans]|uniref:Outer membrane protein with beta-barrel domain n=1 Tax=Hymenobacter chitinivorans DSM 11115 TaxID=1121954 RepID=A0A2M9BRD8_9BACT|nr:outer membrane beta-barrel protein [Hymenobacter chitinivorans]PJJ60515.1 outer membrane protein with beta-barrel domain [Hymenobacter chitinivorans DSM 11115]
MKRFSALLALLLLTVLTGPTRSQAADKPANDDTIVVKLPNQATMTLYTKNKEQLRELRTYRLDTLMALLDRYIHQAELASKNAGNSPVTMEFYPAKDHPGSQAPEQIRVTVRNEEPTTKVAVKGYKFGQVFSISVKEGKNGKDGDDEVSINIGRDDSHRGDSLREANRRTKREEHASRAVHSNFSLDLGLNALTNRSGLSEEQFDLKPTGSRYVSLNWHYDIRLGGRRSPLFLVLGPELAFNNYMFDNNRRLFATDTRTTILREPFLNLEKSKLATTVVNVPLLAKLNFKDKSGNDAFRLGAGGFGGYRLASHTKIKYEDEGHTRKDKDRGSFNLEDFQYGVQGLIGVRGIDLFVKYNMNELFKNNRGPQAQTISFGVSILD